MTTIASLTVDFIANTANFQNELRKNSKTTKTWEQQVQTSVRNVGRAVAASAAAAAVGVAAAYAKSAVEIDRIAKNSAKLGIGTEQLIGLQLAAELTGVSTEKLNLSLQRSTRRISEAANGYGEARGALRELGLDAERLGELSPDAQFVELARAMEDVEGEANRVRLAMKLFDSEGVDLVNTLALGEKGLAGVQAEAAKLGLTFSAIDAKAIEDANDAFTLVQSAGAGLSRQLSIDLAPAFEAVSNAILDVIDDAGGVRTVSKEISDSVKSIVDNFDTVTATAEALAVVMLVRLIPGLQAVNIGFVRGTASALSYQLALARMAGVSGTAAAAQLALASATRAAGAAMAFLGGPVGVALLAAYAIYQFASDSDDAALSATELAGRVDEANEAFKNLSRTKIAEEIARRREEVAKLNTELAELSKPTVSNPGDLSNRGSAFPPANPVATLVDPNNKARISEINELLEVTGASIKDLERRTEFLGEKEEFRARSTQARATAYVQSLQQQFDLHGKVSAAAKLRYEIENGLRNDLNEAQRKDAIALAEGIDRLNQADDDNAEAEKVKADNANIISLQAEKFARLREMALQAQGLDLQIENERFLKEQELLDQEQERLIARGLYTATLKEQFRQAELDATTVHEEAITAIELAEKEKREEAEKNLRDAKAKIANDVLGIIAAGSKEGSKVQRAALVVQQGLALRESLISLQQAIAKANALGFPQNIPAIAQATTVGLGAVNTLRNIGQAHDGLTDVPTTGSYVLQRGERVIKKDQNSDLTKALSNGMGGGSSVNLTVNFMADAGSERPSITQEQGANGEILLLIDSRVRRVVGEDLSANKGISQLFRDRFNLTARGS